MTQTYQVSSTITTVGITAALNAGTTGPQINVAGFRLGSLSAAEGAVATVNDTDVDGFVYQGSINQMAYTVVDQDTVMWTLALDTTVGNFEIGNVGIVLTGNVLFAKAVLPGQSPKYQSSPPTTVGNVKYYNVIMRLANVASLINLSVVQALEMSIPEVLTEFNLPNPLITPFDCYLTDNHTRVGVPVTSVRLNGSWFHATHRLFPGQGQGVIVTTPAAFDSTCVVGAAVYLNSATDKWSLYTGSASNSPVGIMSSSFEITMSGQLPASVLGLSTPLAVGSPYYVGSNGMLSTAPGSGSPSAIAVQADQMFIYFADYFSNASKPTSTTLVVTSGPFTTPGLSGEVKVGLKILTPTGPSSTSLPSNPIDGMSVKYTDLVGNLQAFPLTVSAPAGVTIANESQWVCDENRGSWKFTYYAAGSTWGVE